MDNVKHIYFLGIGGIGMSGLARYFRGLGKQISGYDRAPSDITRALEAEGMSIVYDDAPELFPADVDLIVRTPAVKNDTRVYQWMLDNGLESKMIKRAALLGLISKSKTCLAVAGTHGKTTTTTILTHLLASADKEPSAFLGGISVNNGSNFLNGKSDLVVVEADEFDRSFLQLYPTSLLVTAMDPDHLDIYGTPEEMVRCYEEFMTQVRPGGHLFYNYRLQPNLPEGDISIATYGLGGGDYRSDNVRVENGCFVFDYHCPKGNFNNLIFPFPGRHNVENATGAIAVALQYGMTEEEIRHGLATFKGIKRRFEFIQRDEKLVFIDDYAHHPEEVKAAVRAAKELFPNEQITAVFQPHLFSRTNDFATGFAEALDELDFPILVEIYPARELPMPGVTSDIIFRQMKNLNKKMIMRKDLTQELLSRKNSIKVFMCIGAADMEKQIPEWRNALLMKDLSE